jgi:hypothetical protein
VQHYQDRLVIETLAALNRNLDDLDRLQAQDITDPVATAHIRNARLLLNRASGLVRRLHQQL